MIYEWAKKWNISDEAIKDLLNESVHLDNTIDDYVGGAECDMLNIVRLEAPQKNCRLWRNNIGAVNTVDGRFVRFGLANESHKINQKIKSSDLIGIRKLLITQDMVDSHVGQFVSREVKRADWKYSGTERERAQLAWITFINAMGGDAKFTSGRGSL